MKALSIGSAMIDIIAIIRNEDIERVAMSNASASFLLLEQGRKIDAESITIHVGGGGINTAVALRRLGHEAASLVKVGRDLNAEKVRECLTREGVSCALIISSDKAATGTAVMVSSHDRNASIFTSRGANTLLKPEEVAAVDFSPYGLVYVSSLSGNSADCFPLILDRAKAAGAFVAANPGIRQLTSRGGALLSSLAKLDLLTVNRTEAAGLTPSLAARFDLEALATVAMPAENCPPLLRLGLSFGGFDVSLPAFIAALRALGLPQVLVTDGGDGAYLGDGAGIHYCPSLRVEVAGTAGAGDAFSSTFAAFLAGGSPPQEALRAASVNAASVVSYVDTQSGLMTCADLKSRVREVADILPTALFPWRKAV